MCIRVHVCVWYTLQYQTFIIAGLAILLIYYSLVKHFRGDKCRKHDQSKINKHLARNRLGG